MKDFVFISSSKSSIELLKQIGFEPSVIENPSIDFSLRKKETPVFYTDRITKEKAEKTWRSGLDVLATHKSVFVGRRLIGVPKNEEEIRQILALYTGRNHTIYTGVFLKRADGGESKRRTLTRVKIKNLSPQEIDEFIASKQWIDEIGGYDFSGLFQGFIMKTVGSWTGAKGMPCYEVKNLINSIQ